jgi:hypothetical protein
MITGEKAFISGRPDVFRIARRTGRAGSAVPREFTAAVITAAVGTPGIKNKNCIGFILHIQPHDIYIHKSGFAWIKLVKNRDRDRIPFLSATDEERKGRCS